LRINGFLKIALKGFEFEAVKSNPRLAEFIEGISNRPSVKETYIGDKEYFEALVKRFNLKF
jgi:glutathione S-transferase